MGASGDSSPSSAESSFRELDDVFLQTQTRIWLGEVLQTRLDEHLNISDLLADGELLFEVSQVVWKMLLTNCMEVKHLKAYMEISSRKSSGRYMPYSNVDSFLKVSKILGLTGIDLFSPSDVVEKRNTRKVCMCIRSLSKKARSRSLDVPDFDLVTYTLAMPTNMVGCIRRNLELSKGSFSSSGSYNQYKNSKMTRRKKSSVAAGARNFNSYPQEADIESNCIGFISPSPSMNCASDSELLINLDLVDPAEVSSDINSYTSAQNEFQLAIHDQKKDEYKQCQYESQSFDEPVGCLCSHCVKKDHLADNISSPSWVESEVKSRSRSSSHIRVSHDRKIDKLDLVYIDHYTGNGASTVEDSTSGRSSDKDHVAHDLAILDSIDHGTDNGGLTLFDRDDYTLKMEMSVDSCGSNSPGQTSLNGFGRIHSDNFDDAEVSSTASLGSVTSGLRRHLDFEDQSDEDDLRKVKILFPELQSQKAGLLNSCLLGVSKPQNMPRQENIIYRSVIGYPDGTRNLSRKSCSSSNAHYLNVENKCVMTIGSSGNNGHDISAEVDSPKVFSEELSDPYPTKASDDYLWLKDMHCPVADKKMTIGGTITRSDHGSQEHPNELLGASYFDRICDDSNASSNIIVSQDSEKWSKLSHADCNTSGLKHCQCPHIPHMLAVDNPVQKSDSTVEKYLCLTPGNSQNVGKTDQKVNTVPDNRIPCPENMDNKSSQDERIHGKTGVNAAEHSDSKEGISTGVPRHKHRKRRLLKSLVTGTAVFGALFMLLHLRRRSSRDETREPRLGSSQTKNVIGMQWSIQKRQKEDQVEGVYPAEKLMFSD